jgi:formylglycine-generating enzyme required for sulfatase activity
MKLKLETAMLAAVAMAAGSYADSITHGGTTINMDFVDIGNAGNVADTRGYGAVGYNYRMGTFEVTAAQWASVLAADSNVGNAGSWAGSQPTASASWYEAAKFANWLTTGNAYSGAYQFDGSGVLTAVDRDAAVSTYGTVYVLPTEDEWYKAAYLKSDGSAYTLYATGDPVPTAGVGGENYNNAIGSVWDVGSGVAENNGTYDMNGNVWEWIESAGDGDLNVMGERRVYRGAAADHGEIDLRSTVRFRREPTVESLDFGFRVAAIPEPSSLGLMVLVGGFGWIARRKFRR